MDTIRVSTMMLMDSEELRWIASRAFHWMGGRRKAAARELERRGIDISSLIWTCRCGCEKTARYDRPRPSPG